MILTRTAVNVYPAMTLTRIAVNVCLVTIPQVIAQDVLMVTGMENMSSMVVQILFNWTLPSMDHFVLRYQVSKYRCRECLTIILIYSQNYIILNGIVFNNNSASSYVVINYYDSQLLLQKFLTLHQRIRG